MQLLFWKNKYLPVYSLACFFRSLYFACAVYRNFPVMFTKIAEAGTKGEMSYLDAPNA